MNLLTSALFTVATRKSTELAPNKCTANVRNCVHILEGRH